MWLADLVKRLSPEKIHMIQEKVKAGTAATPMEVLIEIVERSTNRSWIPQKDT